MARKSDYAARVARAQAAGYPSLSAQRTAQAHERGFSSRAAETQAAKAPAVQAVLQHWSDVGLRMTPGMRTRLANRLGRQTYRQLSAKQVATYGDIVAHASHGDDGWFYH